MSTKTLGLSIKQAAMKNPVILNALDANTQKLLQSEAKDGVKLRSVVKMLYYAYCIAGGASGNTRIQLSDPSQAKKVGISAFEQGMKVSQDIIIAGLKVEYASGPNNNTVVGDKAYTNLLYSRTNMQLATGVADEDAGAAGNQGVAVGARNIPVELANADFILIVGGKERYRAPLSSFFSENDSKQYLNGDFEDFVSLQEQLVLAPAGTEVRAELHTADGVAVSNAVNHFIKWTVIGSSFETI